MRNKVAIGFITNFGEESNNSAENASQATFWLYKPRRHVWGVEVQLYTFLALALDGGE